MKSRESIVVIISNITVHVINIKNIYMYPACGYIYMYIHVEMGLNDAMNDERSNLRLPLLTLIFFYSLSPRCLITCVSIELIKYVCAFM